MSLHLFVLATLAAFTISACSTQTRELPTTAPPPASKEEATAVPEGPEAVLPPAMPAAPPINLKPYQGQIKKIITEGSVTYEAIVSSHPCSSPKECSSTKYANVPRNDSECTCAAPCTPYVVNSAEKQRREDANKKLCDNEDWYGVRCPAPDCGFIEFESFRCHGGYCAGLAMGKTSTP